MNLQIIESSGSLTSSNRSKTQQPSSLEPYKVYPELAEKISTLHKHFDYTKRLLRQKYKEEKSKEKKMIKENFKTKYRSLVSLFCNN